MWRIWVLTHDNKLAALTERVHTRRIPKKRPMKFDFFKDLYQGASGVMYPAELDYTTEEVRERYEWKPGKNAVDRLPSTDSANGFYGFREFTQMYAQEMLMFGSALTGVAVADQTDALIAAMQSVWATPLTRRGTGPKHYVIGSVLGWGKYVEGKYGWRVQYAKPETLMLGPVSGLDWNARLLGVAEEYGMRAVSLDEATAMPSGLVEFSE
ncbi:hypothetical protein AB0H43_12775 [Hamadaea sp. NPDC050747]|uniref:hypothetical protein n=1 Tax=Hamadaea sp. NPDC050747 TaxID=3155789 RepID=UPI0033F7D529